MSPLSRGLFSGAFMSSGCNFTRDVVPLAEGEKIGIEIQKRLGAANLAAMRNAPADKILALQAESQILVKNPGIQASAVIDGYFWTGTMAQTLAAHAGSAVPVIANSNGDDNDGERYGLARAHTVAEYKELAHEMYGTNADHFLELYPANNDAEVQAAAHKAAIENGYLAGERVCGELQTKFNGQPTYIDLFVHKHSYIPGVQIADQDPVTVGAYHNADIPFWFGTLDSFNLVRATRNWTAADRVLSDLMMQSLIAFARSGKPETADIKWPAWTEANPEYLVIGDTIEPHSMDIERMDWLAAHPPTPVNRPAAQRLGAHD
jgi:para-nitrobenzyl esterase